MADSIYASISGDIDRFLTKSSIGNFEINRDDAAKKVSFKSSMASGTLAAKDEQLQVEISLSFLSQIYLIQLTGNSKDHLTQGNMKTISDYSGLFLNCFSK